MRVPKIEIMSARIVNETVIKSKICFNFIKARISQRFDFVKANGLCLLCLRSGHSVKIFKLRVVDYVNCHIMYCCIMRT